MKKLLIITLAVLGLLVVPLLAPGDATASLILYYGQPAFNGITPESTPPWLIADFEQDGTGQVKLILTGSLNVASEYFDQVLFNIDPNIVPSTVTITKLSGPNTTIGNTIQDAQNMQGGGNLGFDFDIKFNYPSAAAQRFNDNDVSIFTFTATGLTPESFDFTNPSGYLSAAHIAGIAPASPGGETRSGAVAGIPTTVPPIPEPSTMLLVGIGLAGIFLRGRFKN